MFFYTQSNKKQANELHAVTAKCKRKRQTNQSKVRKGKERKGLEWKGKEKKQEKQILIQS